MLREQLIDKREASPLETHTIGYYWKGLTSQVLLLSDGRNLRGVVFTPDKYFFIPSYDIRGIDKRILTSETAFRAFFYDTWLQINHDINGVPVSININGRLRGGSPGS